MAFGTVRNLPDETYRALRVRAATHGRSIEVEIRGSLECAVRSEGRIKLGTLLAEIGREVGGVDLEIERARTLAEPMGFNYVPGMDEAHYPLELDLMNKINKMST